VLQTKATDTGHAAVSVGLMPHLSPDTQIYCDRHVSRPPAIALGAEPADCVISSANFDAEPSDLIAAERLVLAAVAYRDELLRQTSGHGHS
jgi:hypothetical protein